MSEAPVLEDGFEFPGQSFSVAKADQVRKLTCSGIDPGHLWRGRGCRHVGLADPACLDGMWHSYPLVACICRSGSVRSMLSYSRKR